MDFRVAREMIGIIKTERQDRLDRLKNDNQDEAFHQWADIDEPFINDMCLMVLVALHHQLERELVFRAARANRGFPMTWDQCQEGELKLQKRLSDRKSSNAAWSDLRANLNLVTFPRWMETLRLLANSFKHGLWQQPNKALLDHLRLPPKPEGPLIVDYAPLSQSRRFRSGLAASLGLANDADYCAITEAFMALIDELLWDVSQKTTPAKIAGSLIRFSG
jgi:hypothetical protein